MDKRPLKPAEVTDFVIETAQDKVNGSLPKLLTLGFQRSTLFLIASHCTPSSLELA